MLLVKETSPNGHLLYGRTVVGTSPTQLTSVKGPFVRGILIRAPGLGESGANSDSVEIGDINVETSTGFSILPGGAIEVPAEDPSSLYVISGTPGQNLQWIGM